MARSGGLVLLAWSVPVFLGWSAQAASPRPFRVVTTIAPLYCFVKNIAGEAVELANLLPPNAEPHDYVLSPGDARRLADADLIVENGLGLENFLERVLSKADREKLLDASRGIPPLPRWAPPDADGGGRAAAPPNPHVWLDPLSAVVETENIVGALCRRDPRNAAAYRAGGARWIEKLREIDLRYRRSLDPLPNKKMVSDHDAFAYLAARYGIRVVAVLDARGHAGISPKLLAWAMATIGRERVSVLFSEIDQVSSELRSLSRDMGIPIVPLDSMESGALAADLYAQAAERNRQALVDAFGGRSVAPP